MSARRPQGPPVLDRLPGEEELSRLYQQTPDEQPPLSLDTTVLAAGRRATHPRRISNGLLSNRRVGHLARRWAVPLSLAAALLVSIGVMTHLPEQGREPLPLRQRSQSVKEKREQFSVFTKKMTPPKAADAQIPQSPPSFPVPLAARPTQQAPPAPVAQGSRPLTDQAPTSLKKSELPQRWSLTRDRTKLRTMQEKEMGVREGQPARRSTAALPNVLSQAAGAAEERAVREKEEGEALTPEAWLAQISELFRIGKRREAEANLQAFQQRYPNYTDYPDSLPDEVLQQLRRRQSP